VAAAGDPDPTRDGLDGQLRRPQELRRTPDPHKEAKAAVRKAAKMQQAAE